MLPLYLPKVVELLNGENKTKCYFFYNIREVYKFFDDGKSVSSKSRSRISTAELKLALSQNAHLSLKRSYNTINLI